MLFLSSMAQYIRKIALGMGLSINGATLFDWFNMPSPSLTTRVTYFPQLITTPTPWSPNAFASATSYLLLNLEFTENVYVDGVQFFSKNTGKIYLYVIKIFFY